VPQHRSQEFTGCQLEFDGSLVSDACCVKNLGVFFDKTLNMEKQRSSLAKSCFFQIRNIWRIRPYISNDACKTLVSALVTSRLDYGNALLYGVNASLITKLQRIQNTAARLITRTKRCEHITPVLMDLHWLPVCYRTQYKLLLYVFKALNGLAPVYLKDLITVYQPARTLRSENAMLVVQPSAN